jgi:signal transduction histidine kinase
MAAEADGEGVRLAVRNTGPPLPADARTRLFEKHATAGQGRWQHFGLGLYLCRLAAERHGGAIALVERPGWSVSFEVSFPPVGATPRATAAAS